MRALTSRTYDPRQAFSFYVDFRELEWMLDQLPKAISKTVLKNALKKAAEPIRAAAEANAPVGPTGNLKRGMIISTELKSHKVRAKKSVLVFVGADAVIAPHAHLVEFGTAPRYQENGKYVGQMPANPFFRNAWDATKHQALQIFIKEMETELLKAVLRLRRKAEKGTLSKSVARELMSSPIESAEGQFLLLPVPTYHGQKMAEPPQ
jgi:HK97 gp10 family phage protein